MKRSWVDRWNIFPNSLTHANKPNSRENIGRRYRQLSSQHKMKKHADEVLKNMKSRKDEIKKAVGPDDIPIKMLLRWKNWYLAVN